MMRGLLLVEMMPDISDFNQQVFSCLLLQPAIVLLEVRRAYVAIKEEASERCPRNDDRELILRRNKRERVFYRREKPNVVEKEWRG